jgi:neutral trehalase
VNHKWHPKINKSNVKTAVAILPGQLKNKSSTSKKVLTHLFVVKTAVQKHAQTSITVEDTVEDNENLSRLPVLTVEQKIQYLSSREATSRYFVVTVSEKANKANFSFV